MPVYRETEKALPNVQTMLVAIGVSFVSTPIGARIAKLAAAMSGGMYGPAYANNSKNTVKVIENSETIKLTYLKKNIGV